MTVRTGFEYRSAVIGVGLAGIGALGFWAWRPDPPKQKSTAIRATDEAVPVAVAPPEVPVRAAAFVAPAAPVAVPTATPASQRPNAPAQGHSDEDNRLAVDLSFARETVDVRWAKEAKATIADRLQRIASPKDRMMSLECHSTLCKAEISHDDDGSFRAFHQRISFPPNPDEGFIWPGATMRGPLRTEKDGTIVSYMYLVREGSQLPLLE